jgi:hypothetical protein
MRSSVIGKTRDYIAYKISIKESISVVLAFCERPQNAPHWKCSLLSSCLSIFREAGVAEQAATIWTSLVARVEG